MLLLLRPLMLMAQMPLCVLLVLLLVLLRCTRAEHGRQRLKDTLRRKRHSDDAPEPSVVVQHGRVDEDRLRYFAILGSPGELPRPGASLHQVVPDDVIGERDGFLGDDETADVVTQGLPLLVLKHPLRGCSPASRHRT